MQPVLSGSVNCVCVLSNTARVLAVIPCSGAQAVIGTCSCKKDRTFGELLDSYIASHPDMVVRARVACTPPRHSLSCRVTGNKQG